MDCVPRLRALKLRTFGPEFGRRPIFTVAYGNAVGVGCVVHFLWLKAKITMIARRCVWPSAKNGLYVYDTWGDAPCYGERWPSAKHE